MALWPVMSLPGGGEQAGAETEPPIRAEVLEFRGIESLILSAGRCEGVKRGFCFTIYREDGFTAMVEVVRVWSHRCGARMYYRQDYIDANVGDKATTKPAFDKEKS